MCLLFRHFKQQKNEIDWLTFKRGNRKGKLGHEVIALIRGGGVRRTGEASEASF